MKAYTYIDKGHFDLLEKPEPLITHRYSLEDIEEAYRVFENREPGVIKVAIDCLYLKPSRLSAASR